MTLKVAVPHPSPALNALYASVIALKKGYEIMTGQNSPVLSKVPTWQDLVNMGLIAPDDSAVGSVPNTWNNFANFYFTPTAGSGAFTLVTGVSRWKKSGNLVYVTTKIVDTTNNTAATSVIGTLPTVANSDAHLEGSGVSNKSIRGDITAGSNKVTIYNYDGTYPGANGATLSLSGCYESQ